MKKKNGFDMQIKPIAVVSVRDGAVDAMVKCELLGTVLCRANKIGFMEFEVYIWEIENVEPMRNFTKNGLKNFNKGIHQICLDMIRHCYSNPDKWAVIDQHQDYDVLMLKQDMDDQLLAMSTKYTSRFPLFKEYMN